MTHSSSKGRVAVAMSGGVDSSLAAALLKAESYEVFGVTMRTASPDFKLPEGQGKACFSPSEEDDQDAAEKVCAQLGIPHHNFDLSQIFGQTVIEAFKQEYLQGRTPNPCVICNRQIKFGALIEAVRSSNLAFDAFATGHYVRLEERNGRLCILKGLDPKKDQSYFLNGLKKELLPFLKFPLGRLTKEETRAKAREFGLLTAEREESMDFVSGGDYSPLFDPQQMIPGDIVDETGRVRGRHNGYINYTVGQRKGLGIAAEKPLYVLRIDPEQNQVVVTDKEGLLSSALEASDLNLSGVDSLEAGQKVSAKIRLSPRDLEARFYPLEGGRFRLEFEAPQSAVAPGQYAVMYDGDVLLGGGVIEKALA